MSVQHLELKAARALTSKTPAGTLTVVFLAQDWCGHCSTMKPIYQQLASEFSCCNVKLVQVNAGTEGSTNVARQLKEWIHQGPPPGYPAFYAFNGPQYKDIMLGSCTADAFREWMLGKGLDCSMCLTK
jgi:thiol-disulfide isomerase/thioredoxin